MPLATTLWPISGFWVVVVMGAPFPASGGGSQVCVRCQWSVGRHTSSGGAGGRSVVVAEDEIGDAARLCLALDLVGQPVDGLRAIAQVLHLGESHVHTDAAVDLQARWEADLVEPVIQHCAESVDGADLPEEPGGHPVCQHGMRHVLPDNQ